MTMRKLFVVLMLGVFTLTSARATWAQDTKEDAVKKAQEAVDESGKKLIEDVKAAIEQLKETIAKVDLLGGADPNAMSEIQKKIEEQAMKVLVDIEVTAVLTMLGVLEKTIAQHGVLGEDFATNRIAEIYKLKVDDIKALRGKNFSYSDIVLAHAITKIANRPSTEFVLKLKEEKKSWAAIAQEAGVKFMQLGEELKAIFPK
jgi:predicted nucleotide-binding protein (sugar kinase/HSP70/actin superfamily)